MILTDYTNTTTACSNALIVPLAYLSQHGLILTLIDNQLNVKPSHRVTQEIAEYIKAHKTEIKNQLLSTAKINQPVTQLNQLDIQQQTWFYQVAQYLNYPVHLLLEQQIIVMDDIVELSDRDPRVIATCLIAGGVFNRLNPIKRLA